MTRLDYEPKRRKHYTWVEILLMVLLASLSGLMVTVVVVITIAMLSLLFRPFD